MNCRSDYGESFIHSGKTKRCAGIYKSIKVRNAPVSYTHLDVYKRQAGKFTGTFVFKIIETVIF